MANLINRTLYFGDNLKILREKIPDESFNLIYLDPPFNSKKDYNVLFKEGLQESESQIRAFEDTWHWSEETQKTFEELVTHSNEKISNLMLALDKFVGRNDILAYLTMLTIRLLELHRVLKKTGSLYLHCDPTASHYIKIVLDVIFGKKNFRNEIIWAYSVGGKSKKWFARKHDVIFFYTKSDKWTFNGKAVGVPRKTGFESFGGKIGKDEHGRLYQDKRTKDGKIYRYYLDEGKIPEDVWEIQSIQSQSKERLGFPTQKPEELLERIIKASSNKDDWVLDPFCGCGTTVAVAERLNRNWVGIDITILAINLIRDRLIHQYPDRKSINIDGIPTDVASARVFAQKDPYQFQMWVCDLIGAMPTDKKGADRGIDGIIVYHDVINGNHKTFRKGIVQVKSGHVQRSYLATLKADVEREKADFGVFVTLEPPTRGIIQEAIQAGTYKTFNGQEYPKMQIITIEDIFNGKRLNLPHGLIKEVFRKATRKELSEPLKLFE